MRMHRSVASYKGRPNILLWPDTDEEWRLLEARAAEVNRRYGRRTAFMTVGQLRIPEQMGRRPNPAVEHLKDLIDLATVIE